MKILIVSALFPPDVAPPAPYVKELATRLSQDNEVSVLTYGRIPEAVEGVTIHTVPKQIAPLSRLWQFTKKLRMLHKQHDVVLINNAPSTELPLMFAALFSAARWYLLMSDTKIVYRGWRKTLNQYASRSAKIIIVNPPTARPEIHPFKKQSEEHMRLYEASWLQHLSVLNNTLYE